MPAKQETLTCRQRKFSSKQRTYTAEQYMLTQSHRVIMLAESNNTEFLVCVIQKDDYPLMASTLLESAKFAHAYRERFYITNERITDYLVVFELSYKNAKDMATLIDTCVSKEYDDETVDFV